MGISRIEKAVHVLQQKQAHPDIENRVLDILQGDELDILSEWKELDDVGSPDETISTMMGQDKFLRFLKIKETIDAEYKRLLKGGKPVDWRKKVYENGQWYWKDGIVLYENRRYK